MHLFFYIYYSFSLSLVIFFYYFKWNSYSRKCRSWARNNIWDVFCGIYNYFLQLQQLSQWVQKYFSKANLSAIMRKKEKNVLNNITLDLFIFLFYLIKKAFMFALMLFSRLKAKCHFISSLFSLSPHFVPNYKMYGISWTTSTSSRFNAWETKWKIKDQQFSIVVGLQ